MTVIKYHSSPGIELRTNSYEVNPYYFTWHEPETEEGIDPVWQQVAEILPSKKITGNHFVVMEARKSFYESIGNVLYNTWSGIKTEINFRIQRQCPADSENQCGITLDERKHEECKRILSAVLVTLDHCSDTASYKQMAEKSGMNIQCVQNLEGALTESRLIEEPPSILISINNENIMRSVLLELIKYSYLDRINALADGICFIPRDVFINKLAEYATEQQNEISRVSLKCPSNMNTISRLAAQVTRTVDQMLENFKNTGIYDLYGLVWLKALKDCPSSIFNYEKENAKFYAEIAANRPKDYIQQDAHEPSFGNGFLNKNPTA